MFEFFNVVQTAARLGPQKALSITKFIFEKLDPYDKGLDCLLTPTLTLTLTQWKGVDYVCFVTKVKGGWLWQFFRVILVLVSLDYELPEYKKAQQGLLDICEEVSGNPPLTLMLILIITLLFASEGSKPDLSQLQCHQSWVAKLGPHSSSATLKRQSGWR